MAVSVEQAKEKALLRLKSLGVDGVNDDILLFTLESTLNNLLADLNRKELPDGMLYVWADAAAGQTALSILGTQSEESGEGADGAVTSVKEGDTSVSFDVSSSSRALMINEARRLATPPASAIARYRRLSW